MGQAFSCCTTSARDTNDSEYNMYCRGEQPWKEKIKTNEKKVIFAADPKEKIDQERLKFVGPKIHVYVFKNKG
jgi:hypothetical protein